MQQYESKLNADESVNPSPETSEVYFFGQIEGASSFKEGSDGIFIEISFEYGKNWVMTTDLKKIQTQAGYVDEEDFVCFAHPFSAKFISPSYFGWPKIICNIWKLDETDTIDLLSYGTAPLPNTSGYHNFSFDTWTIHGKRDEETLTYFLDSKPSVNSNSIVAEKLDLRSLIVTKPGPKVHICCEVLMRNFKNNERKLCKGEK